MIEISVHTSKREELIDITYKINEVVQKIGIKEGICYVYCPHTTAGLTINENADPSVKQDIKMMLRKLVPDNINYRHLEGNSDAHIKTSLLGNSLTMFIEKGRLKLGMWQGCMFCEFDGPRDRKVWIKLIESK